MMLCKTMTTRRLWVFSVTLCHCIDEEPSVHHESTVSPLTADLQLKTREPSQTQTTGGTSELMSNRVPVQGAHVQSCLHKLYNTFRSKCHCLSFAVLYQKQVLEYLLKIFHIMYLKAMGSNNCEQDWTKCDLRLDYFPYKKTKKTKEGILIPQTERDFKVLHLVYQQCRLESR